MIASETKTNPMKALRWLVLSLTLILSAGFAAPASAQPAPTRCTSFIFNRTIAGDLLVPQFARCELDEVIVQGDIVVRQGATFLAYNSRFKGTLTSNGFDQVLIEDTRIGGPVHLTNGISTRFGRVVIEDDTRLNDNYIMRVLDTKVAGDLVVRGAGEQLYFCGSAVGGNAWFAHNKAYTLLGGEFPDCAANNVRGDMHVHYNQQQITVANNTVGRNLVCTANDPAPSVYDNQVGGAARGQCASSAPADAGS
jgi:hypothetical protein